MKENAFDKIFCKASDVSFSFKYVNASNVFYIVFQRIIHDDIIKWKHFPRPRWLPRTKASDTGLWCFLWVNNREAGDLRRRRARYDVIVMLNHFQFEHSEHHCFSQGYFLYLNVYS